MQELTLTGATLLDNHGHDHSHSHNNHNDTLLLQSPSKDRRIAAAATAAQQQQQQQQQPCCDHNHSHNHNGVIPRLTLQMPASQLVQQQKHDPLVLLQTLIGVVRMGTYELFLELVQAWRNDPEDGEKANFGLQLYDRAGHTLTHWAAKRVDDVRFVQFMVHQVPYHPVDAKTNTSSPYPTVVHRPTRDDTAMTPLHWACTQPNALAVIKTLLQAQQQLNTGSLLEIRDGSGCTPLLIAAQHGHVETAAYLVQMGADIHAMDTNRDSAIHWAAYKGSLSVLGLLSYYSDDTSLTVPDAYGQTPLHLAALRGHTTVVRYIVQSILNPRTVGSSSTTASRNINKMKQYRAVKEILYFKDKNGRTPYQLAVHKEKPTVAAVLWKLQDHVGLSLQQGAKSSAQKWTILATQTMRSFFSVHSWKLWLGMGGGGLDDVDESPSFPLYYVSVHMVLNIIFHFTTFLPLFGTGSETGVLWDCMGLHVIQMILMTTTTFTLYKVYSTDPGTLNDSFPHIDVWRRLYEQTLEQLAADSSTSTDINSNNNKPKYPLCHTCHIARPYRSKHDRFTRSCILQFDHHCPFVGTTVGLYNYRYFYSFLVSMSMYFVFFWILLFLYWKRNTVTPVWTVVYGVFLGIHMCMPMGMWIYHTQLTAVNLTTNEHINTSRYDYFFANGGGHFHNPWNKGVMNNFIDRFQPSEASYMIADETTNLITSTQQQQQQQSSPMRRKLDTVV